MSIEDNLVIDNESVESLRDASELPHHWALRKAFLLEYQSAYSRERLISLSHTFVNTECMGLTYPEDVMTLIKELGQKIDKSIIETPANETEATDRSYDQHPNRYFDNSDQDLDRPPRRQSGFRSFEPTYNFRQPFQSFNQPPRGFNQPPMRFNNQPSRGFDQRARGFQQHRPRGSSDYPTRGHGHGQLPRSHHLSRPRTFDELRPRGHGHSPFAPPLQGFGNPSRPRGPRYDEGGLRYRR